MRKNASVERYDGEEVQPESCCLVVPVTIGTALLSAFTILSSAMSFTWGVLVLKNSSYFAYVSPYHRPIPEHEVEVIAYATIALSALVFLLAALAIHAVVARKPALLVPFAVILIFSCVVSFLVLIDQLHRQFWGYRSSYRGRHGFVVSLIAFLLKLYFTNAVYQCYYYLRAKVERRDRALNMEEGSRSSNAYVVLPKYEDLADVQPPAYK